MLSVNYGARNGAPGLLPNHKAQVTLEFTFCFILVILIFVGSFLAFIWTGKTLAGRQIAYDETELAGAANDYSSEWVDFYHPEAMKLVPYINRE